MVRTHFPRRAFTLVELIVVIVIIGMVAAITVPAVQSAREAARRVSCANNQRQLALAFCSYSATHGNFPAARPTNPLRGWAIELMPHLEAETFLAAWNLDKDYCSNENKRLLLKYFSVFHCPSTPNPREKVEVTKDSYGNAIPAISGYTSDYYVYRGGVRMYDGKTYLNPLNDSKPVPTAEILDGLSHTIVLNEQCGRPNLWESNGRRVRNASVEEPWTCIWAGAASTVVPDVVTGHPNSVVNVSNEFVYSFHGVGAQAAFLDGSSRMISKHVIPYVMLALNTRNGYENVGVDDLDLTAFNESFVNPKTGLYPDGTSPEASAGQ